MKKLISWFGILLPFVSYAQNIHTFGTGTDSFTSPGIGLITSLYVDSTNNMLYAGGTFEIAGGIPCYGIAKWDGNKWDSLGSGTRRNISSSKSEDIKDIEKYGGDLIICGAFTKVGGKLIKGLARWNGVEWFDVGGSADGAILDMEVYNNELYVVGNFRNIGGIPAKGIAKWNGNAWTDLSQNFEAYCGVNSSLSLGSIHHFNGELHVAGSNNCTIGTNNSGVSKRVSNQWLRVGATIVGGNSDVFGLFTFQNNLYVGGGFTAQAGSPDNNLYYLNNNVAYSTSGGVKPGNLVDMLEYEQELYVCGTFQFAGGDTSRSIAKWNGVQWLNTGLSIKRNDGVAQYGAVQSFAKYKGNLVIAGAFDLINDSLANNIAMVNFRTTFISGLKEIQSFKLYPNPTNATFSIELSDFSISKSISVYNALGQIMLQQKTTEKTFDVSSYAKGMYVVEVQTDKGISRQKLLVE